MSLSVDIRHTLPGLALDVQFETPGGITMLFGASGAGKTSVIKAVAGLIRPDDGRIALGDFVVCDAGRHVPPRKRGLGYIFQDHRLFPHLTVAQNLAYGRRFAAAGGAEMPEARIVEMLGLGDLLTRRPAHLSGGETARVAIGRALLARPRLILADEPLASLDGPRKAEILPHFERLRDELAVPVLYVTHAVDEVARLATHVVALSKGKVTRAGPALEVLADPEVTPSGPRAAGAVIRARVAGHHDDGLSTLLAGGVTLYLPRVAAAIGDELRVRIAAQDVLLANHAPEGMSALNVIPGRVQALRGGAGPGVMVSLDTPCGDLLARITRRSMTAMGLREGAQVWAVIKTVSVAPQDVG